MLVSVCYDVVVDARRLRLARFLDGFGLRVQRSVFEARLDDAACGDLAAGAERIIDPAADGVRVYRLCETCARRVIRLGQGPPSPERQEVIIL